MTSLNERLACGGDHRLVFNAEGLNPYRVANTPNAAVPFGSCTASTAGPRALEGAQEMANRLDAGLEPDAATAEIRSRLRAIIGIPPSCVIALTPSGTDLLYLLNHVVLQRHSHVHHVVVGASELGGGTLRASAGVTFSSSAPHQPKDAAGRAISGLAERCSSEPIYVRKLSGERREDDTVDDDSRAAVQRSSNKNNCVVVHLVAHSKTGLRAPSMRTALKLQQTFGDGVLLLVDAAQGRLAPADIRKALKAGFAVLFTGSKFYSGPPFSGALFLPASWSSDPGPLPEQLGAWFDRASLPANWSSAQASLSVESNEGLVLRWVGALTEMEAYHRTPPRRRARVYATFAGAVYETFGPQGVIDLEFPMPPVHELTTALGAFPTVFGFRVRIKDHWADAPTLKRLHAELDTPHPHWPRQHLGQPVALGPPEGPSPALLRIALGACLVTDHALTPDAGGVWMRYQMSAMRSRIEACVESGMLA